MTKKIQFTVSLPGSPPDHAEYMLARGQSLFIDRGSNDRESAAIQHHYVASSKISRKHFWLFNDGSDILLYLHTEAAHPTTVNNQPPVSYPIVLKNGDQVSSGKVTITFVSIVQVSVKDTTKVDTSPLPSRKEALKAALYDILSQGGSSYQDYEILLRRCLNAMFDMIKHPNSENPVEKRSAAILVNKRGSLVPLATRTTQLNASNSVVQRLFNEELKSASWLPPQFTDASFNQSKLEERSAGFYILLRHNKNLLGMIHFEIARDYMTYPEAWHTMTLDLLETGAAVIAQHIKPLMEDEDSPFWRIPSIYISSSTQIDDQEYGTRLAQTLRKQGFNVWYAPLEYLTQTQAINLDELRQASTEFVIAISSPHRSENGPEQIDINLARAHSKHIIVVRRDGSHTPVATLQHLPTFEVRLNHIETDVQHLSNTIRKLREHPLESKRIKVLLLHSNPYGTPGLRIEIEFDNIKKSIQSTENAGHFQVEIRQAVKKDDLPLILEEEQPNIVHFSGHASKDGTCLVFESADNFSAPLPLVEFGEYLEPYNQHLLVVINACNTAINSGDLRQSVNHSILMNNDIPNEESIKFSTGFYRYIANKHNVYKAFDLAARSISRAYRETPQIFSKAGDGASQYLYFV